MKTFAICLAATCLPLFAASYVPDDTQWSLRFGEKRAFASAQTGCYGTASYEYVIPPLEFLRAFRETLLDHAKAADLEGFVWSETKDPKHPGQRFVLNLGDGEISLVPEVFAGENRGIVFCLCRHTYLKNCSQSGVPALGRVFHAQKDGVEVSDPALWKDPLTTLTWTYLSPGMRWKKAKIGCAARGLRVPELDELQIAQPRLIDSTVGASLKAAGALVWSNTEAEDVAPQAWAMFLDSANARWVPQVSPLPVACVK